MKRILIASACMAISNVAMAWGDECDQTRKLERTVSVAEAKELVVKAGAGELEIVGENRSDIVIKAELCSDDAEALAKMDVTDNTNGDTTTIRTVYPDRSLFGGYDHARIDLKLTVPEKMMLDVDDSSGEAEVKNVAALNMRDSSGSLEIEKIAGDLTVVDSSGSLEIKDVLGDVSVTDSSGGIEASYISGNFVVEVDSSGGIDVDNVKKNVLIKRDSSGSIKVQNVGGDFSVLADGSGGISYDRVAGKVTLPR